MAREYSQPEKAVVLAALDANGGNEALTAKQFGVPRTTLRRWLAGQVNSPDVPELRQEARSQLKEKVLEAADLLIGQIKAKIETGNLSQSVVAFAILVEKLILLEGASGKPSGTEETVVQVYLPENGRDDDETGDPSAGGPAGAVQFH
jgi:transposase-like protein